jgi:hypothetical protein
MRQPVKLSRHINDRKRSSSKGLFTKNLFSLRQSSAQQGFALSLAIGLGLVITAIGITTIFVAQNDRQTAQHRKESGSGLFVAEGGTARMLAQFQKPNNSLLLARNYDTINAETGKTYLGPDGVPNSGDEESAEVDQWSGYDLSASPCFQAAGVGAPNLVKTGVMGTEGSYTLKAYRYDQEKQVGTLFVEGIYRGQESYIAVTFSVKPDLEDFPGILTTNSMGKPGLRGRNIIGSTGNVYYPPANSADTALVGISAPGDANRSSYLNAIWSGSSDRLSNSGISSSGDSSNCDDGCKSVSSGASDGASSDPIEGKIFACKLNPTIPIVPQGTDLKKIKDDKKNRLNGAAGGISYFQADSIKLKGKENPGDNAKEQDKNSKKSLTVDTTDGPVYLYVHGPIELKEDAKIVNFRTDGKPPRVGDFRIMIVGDYPVTLEDGACIQDVFLYNRKDDFNLFTTDKGCPSGNNTSFEGVVWMESILSSKNSSGNRDIPNYSNALNHNSTVTPNATSGIAVSNDVSSLRDLIEYIDWPVRYRVGEIKSWQRVRL